MSVPPATVALIQEVIVVLTVPKKTPLTCFCFANLFRKSVSTVNREGGFVSWGRCGSCPGYMRKDGHVYLFAVGLWLSTRALCTSSEHRRVARHLLHKVKRFLTLTL